MFIKFALLFSSLFILITNSFSQDGMIPIAFNVRRSGHTNQWLLPFGLLKSTPKWDPVQGSPPLSLTNAIQIAVQWMKAREKTENVTIEDVCICSLHEDVGPASGFFFYKIGFATRPFDRMICVVLMDGHILEPSDLKAK